MSITVDNQREASFVQNFVFYNLYHSIPHLPFFMRVLVDGTVSVTAFFSSSFLKCFINIVGFHDGAFFTLPFVYFVCVCVCVSSSLRADSLLLPPSFSASLCFCFVLF